jgi:cyclophilin family peptidyl-prolyl cis-trans isomerase
MRLAIAGLVLLAALLGACGGGDDKAPPKAAPPAPAAPAAAPAPATTGGKPVQWTAPPPLTIDAKKRYFATMHTSKGNITFELYPKETPQAVNSFVFLARQGFYNGTPVHRIIKGFMFQGGDPTGTGTGGPGYKFNDEPVTRDYLRGTLAMANSGPNTNGSQFFVMHQNYPLPKNYIIFGLAAAGLDVVDKIAETPVRPSTRGEASTPAESVTIQRIEVREE